MAALDILTVLYTYGTYNRPMVKKETVSEVMRALVKRRWAKTSKKERSKAARKAVEARWAAYRKARKEKSK